MDQLKKCRDHDHWIQIKGLGDAALLEDIGEHLKINPLVLEDIAQLARAQNMPLIEIYQDGGNLDDVFRLITTGAAARAAA